MQEGQTEEEEMRQQQRLKVMKDMSRKIRAKGRLDANNGWWVSALLAADCEKAGWEDSLLRCYDWLYEVKKRDEVKRLEEEHQKTVRQMIKSADGRAGSYKVLMDAQDPCIKSLSQRCGEEECKF